MTYPGADAYESPPAATNRRCSAIATPELVRSVTGAPASALNGRCASGSPVAASKPSRLDRLSTVQTTPSPALTDWEWIASPTGLSQFVAPVLRLSENAVPPGVATPSTDLPSNAVEAALHGAHDAPRSALHTGFIVLAFATW